MTKIRYLLIAGFLGIIFTFGGLSIFLPDRDVSEFENRTLAQQPTLTEKSLASGEYFKKVETYFTDQFVERDNWVKNYMTLQLTSNKTYVGDYFVTDDNWIFPKPATEFPQKNLITSAKNLNNLGAFLEKKNTTLYFFPMLSKVNALGTMLPSYIPEGRYEANKQYLFSKLDPNLVHFHDTTKTVLSKYNEKQIQEMYFKTDHHWTMKGAFLGYQMMMQKISKDFPIPKDYQQSQYSFSCKKDWLILGSYNRRLNKLIDYSTEYPCYNTPKNYSFKDYIIYRGPIKNKTLLPLKKYYKTGFKGREKALDYSYAYALNYGELNFINPKSNNNLKMLLIKDSYANPIIPMIAHHFKQTTVVDPRYSLTQTTYDLLKKESFDLVVILYNDSNLTGDMFDFNKRGFMKEK